MRTIYFELVENVDDAAPKRLKSNSLSGGERNRIFFRRDGNYVDLSLVSGVDFREDGRTFVLFDADNDGWLDMGITSPNHPRFRIVKNGISGSQYANNDFVQVSLVGGNESSQQDDGLSPRDAYGARLIAKTGNEKRMFHLSCGEGLSTVNSKRVHIGMGEREQIDSLEVTWPSGKVTVRENVKAGTKIEIRETE